MRRDEGAIRPGDKLQEAIRFGIVSLPELLLRLYPRIGLSDTEAMLLLHLLSFAEKERKPFPTIEELQGRMAAAPGLVVSSLRRLVKDGYIRIDEQETAISRVRFETYNFEPLQNRLLSAWQADGQPQPAPDEPKQPDVGAARKTIRPSAGMAAPERSDLFTTFEREFARPLTPMELETIAAWIDKDGYKEELIRAALKEAVFAGKVHFRYVDRILLDWARNRVATAEQAKEHAQRYRGK